MNTLTNLIWCLNRFGILPTEGTKNEDSNFGVAFPLKKARQQHGRWAFNPKSS